MTYFDDLRLGQIFATPHALISQEEAVNFAREWDPQPFHIDPEQGQKSLFGRLTASGLHTLLMSFRLCVATGAFTPSAVAGLELGKVQFRKPVFPGDTIYAILSVMEKRLSDSRPRLGIVQWSMETRNQHDEVVLSMHFTNMLMTRLAADGVGVQSLVDTASL